MFKISVKCAQDPPQSLLLLRVNLHALTLNEHNMRDPPLQFHIKLFFFFFAVILCEHADFSIPLLSCFLPRVWWSARCHRTPRLHPPRTRSPGTTRPRGAPPPPARASSSGCRRTPYGPSAPRLGPPLPGSSGAHPWPGTRGFLGQQRGCSDQILPSNQPCSAFPALGTRKSETRERNKSGNNPQMLIHWAVISCLLESLLIVVCRIRCRCHSPLLVYSQATARQWWRALVITC